MKHNYNDINDAIEDLTIKHIIALNERERQITHLKCELYSLNDELEVLKHKYKYLKDRNKKQDEEILDLKIKLNSYRSFYGLKVGE